MKKAPVSVWIILLVTSCSAQNNPGKKALNNTLCIPKPYSVSVGGSSKDLSGSDPEGGGYSTSIQINGPEMAQLVSGFTPEVQVGNQVHYQALYVMLAPATQIIRNITNDVAGTNLEEINSLLRTDSDPLSWQVVEQNNDNLRYWGTCSDSFIQPGSFDCLRDLAIKDLGLTYTIHQKNLHLYPVIDALLREKIEQWRCASGSVLIER